jgi:hypothetical protein
MGIMKSLGLKSSDPPKVNKDAYAELLALQKENLAFAQKNAADQLAWAKEAYANDMATAKPIIDAAMKRMATQDAWATEDRARYKSTFQPLEDDLVADAQNYDSEERKIQEAGRAMALQQQGAEGARQNALRDLEAYGVDPSSTRYGAIDISVRAANAAAAAAAGNEAMRATEGTARQLRSEAINVGRGLPGQAQAAAAGATGSGAAGAQTGLATTASGANTMGTGMQWQGASQGAIQGAGAILGQEGDALMNRYNAKVANNNAWMGLAGTAIGAGAAIYGAKEGGAITKEMSPSRGAATDDVPLAADVGEFMMPEDVVKWKGEEFFQRLIETSRKAKQAPKTAVPAMAAAPRQAQRAGAIG